MRWWPPIGFAARDNVIATCCPRHCGTNNRKAETLKTTYTQFIDICSLGDSTHPAFKPQGTHDSPHVTDTDGQCAYRAFTRATSPYVRLILVREGARRSANMSVVVVG